MGNSLAEDNILVREVDIGYSYYSVRNRSFQANDNRTPLQPETFLDPKNYSKKSCKHNI